MLVMMSDLHLVDETTANNIHESAYSTILGPEIALAASKKQAQEIHVVLLGDIFDLVSTSHWVERVGRKDRPWNGSLDPDTGMNAKKGSVEKEFNAVLDGILATNTAQSLIAALNGLPAIGGRKLTVTYVVGNHDRAFNAFPSLQQKLAALFPAADVRFANLLEEPSYGVLARHGYEWDEHCYGLDFWNEVLHPESKVARFDARLANVMTIGEVVTAELLAGFVFNMQNRFAKKRWKSSGDGEFLNGLRDVNNIRPMSAAFIWLKWFTRNQDEKYKAPIEDALIEALDATLGTELAKQWDNIRKPLMPGYAFGDLTDQLQAALDDLNRGGLQSMYTKLPTLLGLQKVKEFFWPAEDHLFTGAGEEFRSRGATTTIQYIVYGHTHDARQDFFAGTPNNRVKMYVNTGTYLPFYQLCLDERDFALAHRMTMLFFYGENEDQKGRKDRGPTMELWNGVRRKLYQ